MKKFLLTLSLFLALCACNSKNEPKVTVTVTNPIGIERNELVSFPQEQLVKTLTLLPEDKFIIVDEQGEQLPYQITYDYNVIFPVEVKANATQTYTVSKGTPETFSSKVFGKLYTERLDDIAWENDRIAFRTYGPALQAKGEKAFGYDVWLKSVDTLVVEKRYDNELHHGITYHQDHGNGMDCFSVGPTLGGGTAALLNADSTIAYPYCWKEYEILDNGPLRFTVKLSYNPFIVEKDSNVIETRIISLDKGSQLNKTTISYANLSKKTPIVTGLVIHPENPDAHHFDVEKGLVSAVDLTDNVNNNNGQIFLGTVATQPLTAACFLPMTKKEIGKTDASHAPLGHALAYSTYKPNTDFSYYWGAGWSKYGFSSLDEWDNYLKDFSEKLNNPLQVSVK